MIFFFFRSFTFRNECYPFVLWSRDSVWILPFQLQEQRPTQRIVDAFGCRHFRLGPGRLPLLQNRNVFKIVTLFVVFDVVLSLYINYQEFVYYYVTLSISKLVSSILGEKIGRQVPLPPKTMLKSEDIFGLLFFTLFEDNTLLNIVHLTKGWCLFRAEALHISTCEMFHFWR